MKLRNVFVPGGFYTSSVTVPDYAKVWHNCHGGTPGNLVSLFLFLIAGGMNSHGSIGNTLKIWYTGCAHGVTWLDYYEGYNSLKYVIK